MKTQEKIEPGIFRRHDPRSGKLLPKLWIHYPKPSGGTAREPAQTTSLIAARKLRAKRMEEAGRGEPGRAAAKVRVKDLLDALLINYGVNGRSSLRTLRGHLAALRPAVGHLRAIDCTTDVIEKLQLKWQQAGVTAATVNRRCTSLRRAFSLAHRARKLHIIPYVPRLAEYGVRGRYIAPADAAKLRKALPAHVRDVFVIAHAYGIRKGQLTRTQRRFVDLTRGVVAWPP